MGAKLRVERKRKMERRKKQVGGKGRGQKRSTLQVMGLIVIDFVDITTMKEDNYGQFNTPNSIN